MLQQLKNADVSFAPILGVMAGMLYSFSDYEDGREHTVQLCLFVLSVTIVWTSKPSGWE